MPVPPENRIISLSRGSTDRFATLGLRGSLANHPMMLAYMPIILVSTRGTKRLRWSGSVLGNLGESFPEPFTTTWTLDTTVTGTSISITCQGSGVPGTLARFQALDTQIS